LTDKEAIMLLYLTMCSPEIASRQYYSQQPPEMVGRDENKQSEELAIALIQG
jgi:hypothetical protein